MRERTQRGTAPAAGAVALLGGALAWVAFLSYGMADGRYETWQVLGSGAGVIAAVFASRLVARGSGRVFTILGVAVGFAVPWVWSAARTDPTGLYAVGALLLVIGLLVSAGLLTLLADRVFGRWRTDGTTTSR